MPGIIRWTGTELTELQYNQNFDLLGGVAATAVTIAAGIISTSGTGWYSVDTEGAAASDELTRINGTSVGDLIQIRPTNAARQLIFRHGSFLKLQNGTAFITNSIYDSIWFRGYGSDICVEIHRIAVPA